MINFSTHWHTRTHNDASKFSTNVYNDPSLVAPLPRSLSAFPFPSFLCITFPFLYIFSSLFTSIILYVSLSIFSLSLSLLPHYLFSLLFHNLWAFSSLLHCIVSKHTQTRQQTIEVLHTRVTLKPYYLYNFLWTER